MALNNLFQLLKLSLTGLTREILSPESVTSALLVLVQIIKLHLHCCEISGTNDVLHVILVGDPFTVSQKINCIQYIFLDTSSSKVGYSEF